MSEAARRSARNIPAPVQAAGAQGAAAVAAVAEGAIRMVNRVATAPLSRDRVLAAHRADGRSVATFNDIRGLDLADIDRIKPRDIDLRYAASGALFGALSGLAVTGGEIAIPTGAGGGAGLALIAGAVSFDAATTTLLSAAVVGHVGIYYGYDPVRPEEKLFSLAVLNWGTATSVAVKQAAFADLSILANGLYAGKSWIYLNETVTSRIATAFARQFQQRLIKRTLGKFVPVAAIVAGASLNWLTLEQIADAADAAYRRRFLLEKYPHLAEHEDPNTALAVPTTFDSEPDNMVEEDINVVELAEAEGVSFTTADDEDPGNEPNVDED